MKRAARPEWSGLAIKRTNTADQVAELLASRIFAGDVTPGSPLREESLATSLGVSRNTLREAIRVLSHQGIVRHHAHRGAVVTLLSESDITDIFRIRRLLEPAGLDGPGELAATDRAAFESAVHALTRAVEDDDAPRVVEADMRFHRAFVDRLGSERLSRFFGHLLDELRLGLVLLDLAPKQPDPVASHRQMLDALVRGKRERCRDLLLSHLNGSERRLMRIVAQNDSAAESP
jgi:DNA-binding GntR family transcriptional regulator